ncbi:hypothetical protein ARMGADRAFT_570386 [Armillaria gallica]|uniref:Protein kinase domain-containing protein n=1 Tax=Armillaria gallica TaxID=47427 RepID=A0A2H3DSJ9_ARMGA|nr:hypothetical protein ARMGADRAFT_570386 [Armillaria gallica]
MRNDLALKVMTNEATQAPEHRELEFIQHLRYQNPGPAGYPHVVHLTDSFYIDGPHERHICVTVVTEMVLCNLFSLSPSSLLLSTEYQNTMQNASYGMSSLRWIMFTTFATSYI